MKKTQFLLLRLVLLLFLISGMKAASAQTWPMPGAHWNYCITSGPSPAGSTEMTVTGDTLIDGTTYTVIEHLGDYEKRTLYTRFSDDTVYRYVNGQEYLYFSYNLEVGDVYTTFRSSGFNWSDSACNSVKPLKVTSSQMVEYGEQTLQQWTLQDTLIDDLYPIEDEHYEFVFVERIGVINTYPLIHPGEPVNQCIIPTDYARYSLGAYEDDGFYYMFEECLGTGCEENPKVNDKIRITPNPAHDFFEIDFFQGIAAREYYAKLFDLTGHEVLSTQISKENSRIDVSGIKPGFYMIRLHSPNNKTDVIAQSLIIE